MKLEEAIRIKTRTLENYVTTDPDKIYQADQLSIEAMKALNNNRFPKSHPIPKLLPGETKGE